MDSPCKALHLWSIGTMRLFCTVVEMRRVENFSVTTLTFLG